MALVKIRLVHLKDGRIACQHTKGTFGSFKEPKPKNFPKT